MTKFQTRLELKDCTDDQLDTLEYLLQIDANEGIPSSFKAAVGLKSWVGKKGFPFGFKNPLFVNQMFYPELEELAERGIIKRGLRHKHGSTFPVYLATEVTVRFFREQWKSRYGKTITA